jgi:hypothetical protein
MLAQNELVLVQRHLDGLLVPDLSNAEASQVWEGQLCLAVKDSSLCFLFENKGD